MACDPKTLLSTVKCFACLNDKDLEVAQIGLLTLWALQVNGAADVTPKGLLSQAACFQCLPAKDRALVILSKLCGLTVAPETFYILTEGGDILTTEAGDRLRTE